MTGYYLFSRWWDGMTQKREKLCAGKKSKDKLIASFGKENLALSYARASVKKDVSKGLRVHKKQIYENEKKKRI